MIKENKQMQIGNSAVEYLAPSVEVEEIKAMRVICQQSPVTTGITSMKNEDGEW